MQLLTVVVGRGLVDLGANLVDAPLDVALLAGAVDDGGVVLVDDHPFGTAQVVQRQVFELDAQLLGDHAAAGQDGDVFQHGLAAVAEARRLDRGALQRAANLVHDERGERLALDVLGHDQERLAALGHGFEHGQQILHGRDLLLVDEQIDVLEHALHAFRVGHEVGGEIAAVELHPLDDVERGVQPLGLFDGNHALAADLVHGLGDDAADRRVVVGGDGAHLGDFGLVAGRFGQVAQLVHDRHDGFVDAALDAHRVVARGDHLDAFRIDRPGQHGRGGGPVTGHVGGLAGDLLDHLGAHVLELVFEFDLLGDGHAVLGHVRRAEGFFDDHVAALGAEGDGHRVGQHVHPFQSLVPRVLTEFHKLGSHSWSSLMPCPIVVRCPAGDRVVRASA